MRPLALVLVLAGASASCSLMGLDRYPLPVCSAQADCEGLNQSRGISASDCNRFQCVLDPEQHGDHTCRLRPRDSDGDGDPAVECGGSDCDDANPARSARVADPNSGAPAPRSETCDGVDNDCNGVVDDGALFAGPATMFPSALATATSVQPAPSPSGRAGFVVSPASAGETTRWVQPGASGGGVALRFRTEQSSSAPFTSAMRTPDDQSKCFAPAPLGTAVTDCFPGEAAAGEIDGAGSGTMVLAAVDRNGCAAGVLRVGVFDRATSGPVDVLGPGRRSPLANGVGTTTWPVVRADGTMDPNSPSMATFGTCTGESSGRSPAGATRPAVAPLGVASVPHMGTGTSLPQALVAWLGRPAASDACAASAAPVEAQVVWLESNVPPGWNWLNASGSGQPVTLGAGRGDAPPAVLATTTPPGYLVAFPAASGGVALRFVAAVDTSVVPQLDSASADLDQYNAAPEVVRATPALAVRDLGTVLATMGALESVSIAPGAHGGGAATQVDLGLAVQTGCGAGVVRRVSFARVRVDLAGTAMEPASTQPLGGSASTSPRVQYLPSGVLAPGALIGGRTVDPNSAGGWWVSWVDAAQAPATLAVARVSELDGTVVDAAPARAMIDPPGEIHDGLLVPSLDGAGGPTQLSTLALDPRGGWVSGLACRAQ